MSNTEVGQFDLKLLALLLAENDIAWFEVAVNDAAFVSMAEGVAYLRKNRPDVCRILNRSMCVKHGLEAQSFHVLHDQILPVIRTDYAVDEMNYVLMA